MQLLKWLWTCALLTLAWSLGGAESQFEFFNENGTPLTSPVVVGSASDVIVLIRCDVMTSGEPGNWAYTNNGSAVPSGLAPFGTSQDSGTLRIFPVSLLQDEDQFTCMDGGEVEQTQTLRIDLAETLFFSEPVPPTTTLPVDQFTCSVPDIPPAVTQIVQPSSDSLYCQVETERGLFRSRGVAVIDSDPVPTFQIQPMNITVGNSDRAAFACSVAPNTNLQMIKWFFMADPGSGSGMNLAGELMDGADNVTIVTTSGSSVLIIENVGSDREGQYYCTATFVGGTELDSDDALFILSDAAASDGIILVPPATLTVDEGENVSVPCVTSGSAPQFLFNRATIVQPNITPTDYSLDFVSIQRESTGQYSCEFGEQSENFMIEVLAPLRFELVTFEPETIARVGDTVSLQCNVSGNPPSEPIVWLRNGSIVTGERFSNMSVTMENVVISTLTIDGVQREDAGFYQCLAQVQDDPSTAIVASTYLNVYFLENITITPSELNITLEQPPDTPATITLNCSLDAHPLPQLTWSLEGEPLEGSQAATGFMEQPFSELTVNTSRLVGREEFVCLATQEDETVSAVAVVFAFSVVTITRQPETVGPVQVGDLASFTCAARSIPTPNITWFRLVNGDEVPLVENGDNINITVMALETFTVQSTLLLRVTEVKDFTSYFCVADNGFNSNSSETVMLVQAVAPSFIEDPQSVLAAAGYAVSFNCTATGLPSPNITWMDSMGNEITDDEVFNISTLSGPNSTSSCLQFVASLDMNGTLIHCLAENVVSSVESDNATITIGGVPCSPGPVLVTNILAREATVSWQKPFSFFPITQYQLTLTRVDTGDSFEFRVNPGDEGFSNQQLVISSSSNSLRPFRSYTVSVVAVNRVDGGAEATSEQFTTEQAAPEAPPTNITTSATRGQEIDVSWEPPPEEEQNGIITNYTVQFQIAGEAAMSDTVVGTSITLVSLQSGMIYQITVAAATIAGLGPFSNAVSQRTLEQPPALPPVSTDPDQSITLTTIPIVLPSIPGASASNFSHFWVIAMKLNNSITAEQLLSQNPAQMFSDNSSFVNFSTNVPVGVPYIVAEIDAMNLPMTFVLGDENGTRAINDFPNLYINGPLNEGTRYTAFVWGFTPPVSGNFVAKRQAVALPRQYNFFSSSSFLTPIFTASPSSDGGLSGGAVAGIVIAIFFFVVVVVGLAVIIFLLWGMRRMKEWGPPPSRKGSMRLREHREVITNVSFRGHSELQDLSPDDVREPVMVEDLGDYVKKMHSNTDHLFSEEYEILTIKSPSLPHVQCSMPFNVNKNRYANINCFDDTRVPLSLIPGVDGSDFVNANFIDGYQRRNAYIATQGPLPNTTPDFWRMVWEQQSCCIIMLTNLVEKSRAKCHQYWPEAGSVSFGDLTVTLIETQELAYYTIRTFRMNRGNDRREVKQFHYTGWPDFGVPDHPNPVIQFMRRISNFKRTLNGPDIIHCSAGVGRTGTLIAIQAMMQMMNEEGKVDIFNFILAMRRQRNYMVQTERQYIFIHDTILELIKVGDTEVPIQSLRRRFKELQAQDAESELSGLEEEFIHLQEIRQVDEAQFHSAQMPVNLPKNRFPDILPYDSYRVRLLMHPGVSGSDYFNASYIDGYQRRHQYIVTQGPLKNTVDDFWRMVWEHRVSAIMMLCQLEEKGKEQCVRYWPTEKVRQHGDLFVELSQEQEFPTYTMREFSITNTKVNESRMVKQYQYSDWHEDRCPTNAATIIDLMGVLQKAQHQSGGGPVVVHDSSPIGRTGMFCILSNVLEQVKVEGIVDLFFSIHSLRQQQPGLINSFELYKFSYIAVMEFLDSFDHYANFD